MPDVYYITNWPYHEHRDMAKVKHHSWVKAKVDFQGDDWMKIANAEDPCAVLATWAILRGLALQSPYRGLLIQDGHVIEPHTCETIAEKSRFPLEKLLYGTRFLVATVGWVGLQRDCNDFATLSSKLWRKRFTPKGLRVRQNVRTFGADCAENCGESAQKARLHNITIHNITEHNITEVRDAWNEAAETLKLSTVLKLTDTRRAKVRKRLEAADWPWREALKQMAKSPFLLGENDRKWKANFDWFIQSEDNAYKIIEGKYGKQDSASEGGPRPL